MAASEQSSEQPDPEHDGADAAGVSDADLEACLRVLRTLATPEGGVSNAFREPRFKPLRQAMQLYLDDIRGQLFHGQGPDKYRLRKEKKREKTARQQQDRAMDRAQADKTRMRAERLRMLGELEQDAATGGEHLALGLVPDGAVDCDLGVGRPLLLQQPTGEGAEGASEAGVVPAGASAAEAPEAPEPAEVAETSELHTLRACYTCKARYRSLHFFYAQLCPACAALNYEKRMQLAPLEGRVILVTGARVKIGFQVALKLLRCGATVLATSRFAVDAATRFAALPDAASWQGRLRVYGLDLRDLAALERFCGGPRRPPRLSPPCDCRHSASRAR